MEDARADCQRNSEELDVLKNVRTNLEQENEHLKEVVKKLEEQPENAVSQLNNSVGSEHFTSYSFYFHW